MWRIHNSIQLYKQAVSVIKEAILHSQYRAAKMVTGEELSLNFGIGAYVSNRSRQEKWGTSIIESISEQLRRELPGLRGFSARSIRNMRTFYEYWTQYLMRVCQNTQYKNIKLVVCPFMDAQRVFHFSVNLTFKSLVGNKYCVYRHK